MKHSTDTQHANPLVANVLQALCRIVAVAIMLQPATLHAVPRLPESEPEWKNVVVGGKKHAVFSMFADSRGLMWIGTNNGLYFYDGVATHSVCTAELFGSQIYSMVEKDDRLYLGTNNGLMVYDYLTGGATPYAGDSPKEIRCLMAVGDQLWIGSLAGIYVADLKRGTTVDRSAGLPHRSVYSMLRDSRGTVYAGTYNGLARLDTDGRQFASLKTAAPTHDAGTLFVNSLLEADDRQSIYVGCEGALYEYVPTDNKWTKLAQVGANNIKSLARGEAGHVLVGTDDGVFDLHEGTAHHWRHDSRQELSLGDNEIWCILSDADNNMWAGHERGFSIASNSKRLRTVKLSRLTHSGEGNDIHVIWRDSRGDLWLAGTNGAIRLHGDAAPSWYRHTGAARSLSHNRVRAIHEDNEGNVWFATDAGINRYNRANNSFDIFRITDATGEHNANWVYALVEDGDSLWTGSFLNGLHCVKRTALSGTGGTVVADKAVNSTTREDGKIVLENNYVNNLVADANGNLWILLYRDSRLTRYSPATGATQKYDIHQLTGEYPTCMKRDSRSRIWCGFDGGVVVFDADGTHRIVRFPHTNSDESVLTMGNVGDGMWISTQSNVWAVDGATLEAKLLPIPQKSYTAVYEDKATNRVLLGGTDEIVEVDSRGMNDSQGYNSIKMMIAGSADDVLNLYNIKSAAQGLTVPNSGSVTLVVSTLNYSPEAVQRYMYKLAASATDTIGGWVVMPEGSNIITLSGLNMGKYTVLVRTVGSPEAPLPLPLRVSAPPALSWWAISLYVLMVAAAVFWIVWYMRNRSMRQLRESERQSALDNVERKLQFLSSISHDLKTPLSMILGPVSMMKEKAKDPETKKSLEHIYDNAVRLNNMIHRTLELQHLEDTDENLLILSTFDVVEFCKDVFEVFEENNPAKKFVFHSSSPQQLIEADAVKFESVVTNLLSNACKYSDEGATISLGISTHGSEVEIVVADDGVGIADIDQSLVFQRMFRAPSQSKVREGTGLGLYLIKKYLELMGGNINLYSKEGQGTSFVVTLPISDKIAPEARTDTTDSGEGAAKILIVEDNLQISAFITDLLKAHYTCLTAENGRAGLAIASSFAPDLIIADEMMPIMNGLEMVRRMKQHPRLSTTPIIMLTAKNDNKTENESIKLGIDVFMSKPFEPQALLGRVRQQLKARTEIREKVRMQTIAEAEAKPIEAESVNEKTLAKIAKIIEENISDPDLNVNLLCEKCGMPNKQLYRLIKRYMGVAPLDYIRRVRLQKAAVLLSQHRFTVAEISYMVGFKTPSYFTKCFVQQYGVKPSQYQSDDEATRDIG